MGAFRAGQSEKPDAFRAGHKNALQTACRIKVASDWCHRNGYNEIPNIEIEIFWSGSGRKKAGMGCGEREGGTLRRNIHVLT